MKKIYIVVSYTGTLPGRIIRLRSYINFTAKYSGKGYSHVSICQNKKLETMKSFARIKISNPFLGGFVEENIRDGLFKKYKNSRIAVMELSVTEKQYDSILKSIEQYWARKECLKFNYRGLVKMLICGRGIKVKDRFFCSEWLATLLEENGVRLFGDEKPRNIRPYFFYEELRDKVIYEGLAQDYPKI